MGVFSNTFGSTFGSVQKGAKLNWEFWKPQLGDEKINQSEWFNLSYWGGTKTGWSTFGNTLSCDGNSGNLAKGSIFTFGKVYKIDYSVTVTSGRLGIYDGNWSLRRITETENYTMYYVPRGTTLYIESTLLNGTLSSLSIKEVLNFQDGAFDSGSLVITFDDGKLSNYTDGFPLITSKGVKCTHYIISDYVGSLGYMTWNQLNELNQSGFDIQCHSKTHGLLTNLTSEQVKSEMISVNNAFIYNGLPSPQHHAYPGGIFNQITVDAVSEYRKTARNTLPNLLFSPWNNHIIPVALSIDNISDGGIVILKEWLDLCKLLNVCGVIYGHGVSVNGGSSEVSVSKLTEIIDYAKQISLEILTMSEAYNKHLRKSILIK